MSTQAHTAGPGRDREVPRPARAEAAGPACPRLVWEEVTVRIHADAMEARVRLAAGPDRFTGLASSSGDRCPPWQLAAAATVSALQRYLQQCARDEPAPRVQLAHLATATTGIGLQVITATLALAHGSYQTHLLGTALVRNDWCSTAVAAALDAASRPLGLFPRALPGRGNAGGRASTRPRGQAARHGAGGQAQ